jgi:acetyl-CoA synthetase
VTEHAIETMLLEERRYPPPPEFAAQANAQPEIYDVPFEEFWEREGRERLTWFCPDELYGWKPPAAKWFLGGRLNVCFNCVDRHVKWVAATRSPYCGASRLTIGAEITYAELNAMSCVWPT